MSSNLLSFLLCLAIAAGFAHTEAFAQQAVDPCNSIPGYIVDKDPKGLNVRKAPQGKIITTIPAEYIPALAKDPGMHAHVLVTGSDHKGWLRVRITKSDYDENGIAKESDLIPGREGWVSARLIATGGRGYSGADPHLYSAPSQQASVIGDITGLGNNDKDGEITILDCTGDFFRTETALSPRFKLRKQGWLHISATCPTPLTTCP